jgi:hypothetical protein
MSGKVGIAIVAVIVLGLVIALGYVVSQNSGQFFGLLQVPGFARPGVGEVGGGSAALKVIAPAGGETLTQGTVYTFRWQGGGAQVSLSVQRRSLISGKSPVWSANNIRNTGSQIFYVPANLSGSYTFTVTSGDAKAVSRPFTVQEGTASSGWTRYVDSQNLFELQYPAKIRTSELRQEDAYPQKQYSVTVPDFVRATLLSSAESGKKLPSLTLLVFRSRSMELDLWLEEHAEIKRAYSSQSHRAFNGMNFYKFSTVKQDVTYRRGEPIYRDRTDVPQEMYVTVAGAYAYAILVDFGPRGEYTISPEEIIKTFKIR